MDSCNGKQSPLALSDLEKARMVEQILKLIEEAKERSKERGEDNFQALTECEIMEKLNSVNTPFLYYQAWSSATSPGGSINYNTGVYNPDPVNRIWMYAHAFVGPANMVTDTGIALLNVDARFPRLTQPSFPGLTLAPGGSSTLSFTLNVPGSIEPSNYLGNTFLFHGEYHGIGTYYARGFWPFRVN